MPHGFAQTVTRLSNAWRGELVPARRYPHASGRRAGLCHVIDGRAQERETSWPHTATPTASRQVAKTAVRSSRFELAETRWRQVLNVL